LPYYLLFNVFSVMHFWLLTGTHWIQSIHCHLHPLRPLFTVLHLCCCTNQEISKASPTLQFQCSLRIVNWIKHLLEPSSSNSSKYLCSYCISTSVKSTKSSLPCFISQCLTVDSEWNIQLLGYKEAIGVIGASPSFSEALYSCSSLAHCSCVISE